MVVPGARGTGLRLEVSGESEPYKYLEPPETKLLRVLNGEGQLTAKVNEYAYKDSLHYSRTEATALS